jgi:hypothetical protein
MREMKIELIKLESVCNNDIEMAKITKVKDNLQNLLDRQIKAKDNAYRAINDYRIAVLTSTS